MKPLNCERVVDVIRGPAGVVAMILFLLIPAGCSAPQGGNLADLRKQVETLQRQQSEILKALAAHSNPVPSSLELNPSEIRSLGKKTAAVTLVEYFDYQCPFCARFFEDAMPELEKNYITTGRLRFVALDYPLETIHSFALVASEAAQCANDQGKFWPMHDELLRHSYALDRKSISLYAHDVELDIRPFQKCLNSGKYAGEIRNQEAAAGNLGVRGTPTFFLGVMDHTGRTLSHLRRFDGAVSYAALKPAIDQLLAQKN